MPEAAWVLLLITVAAWVPGRLALQRLNGSQLRPVERHFAALSLGLALVGWTAFVMAELGVFSPAGLGAVWAVAVVVLGIHARRAQKARREARGQWTELLLLALWLPAALWLFLRPHEAILGGADAGVYVSTAAHIARRGAILVQDATLAQMDPALQAAVLRPIPDAALTPAYLFPGFNVTDAAAGAILPDFFHYHAVWQAVAFALGDVAGGTTLAVQAALLMPGLWALLGAVAVYLTLRQALGASGATRGSIVVTAVAALALAALSINAIQVWFARYPVTETLTQYLMWSGLWALNAWLAQRHPQRLWGLLAGVSLGLVLLTRIDTLFVLALPALVFVWQLGRGRANVLRRANLWFYLPMGLLALHTVLHGAFISRPYFARVAGYGQLLLGRWWLPVAALALVGALAGWFLRRRGATLWRPGLGRALQLGAIVAVLGLTAYGWFVRPVYGALPSYTEWYDGQTIVLTDRENLLRLGWYLGPLGVWLGVAGACLLIWRAKRRTLPLLGVGLFFSALYLWRIQANPHQIYVMRRYVPVVAPFFVVAGASLFHVLWVQAGRLRQHTTTVAARALVLLLALLWLGGMGWSARGFVTQVDYRGLTAQLHELDERLDENSVLLFDDQAPVSVGDALGTPLHFLFGHDAYTLRAPQAVDDAVLVNSIESWQNSGRSVYWIGAPDWLQAQAFDYRAEVVTLTTTALEGSYDHKPYRILPLTWRLTLNLIEPR